MTLLLGPPGSGKTTLLLALSGRLGKSLKVYKLCIYLYSQMLFLGENTQEAEYAFMCEEKNF
jgi:ABC-type multidrug transport system ATPase subunit